MRVAELERRLENQRTNINNAIALHSCVTVDHPPAPRASPDRPGAVTVSRIVARNSGHPEPYTGTRTVLVCSSRPRGSAAAAGGRTPPRTPPLRWRGPPGARNTPDNSGPAAGGFTQALGGWAGSKLERVEVPAGSPAGWAGLGPGGVQTRERRISRVRGGWGSN